MGIRVYKPTSPGRRNSSVNDYAEVTRDKPEKTLCKRIKKYGGRNHSGKTTVRFRGGGARRIYRKIDFKRDKDGIDAKVVAVEYDPNRTCHIALLEYADGEKRYILAPNGLKVGETLESGPKVEPKVGNCMPLATIPVGLEVHNIELNPALLPLFSNEPLCRGYSRGDGACPCGWKSALLLLLRYISFRPPV